jgi:hypothetical protein
METPLEKIVCLKKGYKVNSSHIKQKARQCRVQCPLSCTLEQANTCIIKPMTSQKKEMRRLRNMQNTYSGRRYNKKQQDTYDRQ